MLVCIVRLIATESFFRGLGSRDMPPSHAFHGPPCQSKSHDKGQGHAKSSSKWPQAKGLWVSLSAAKLAAAVVLCSASEASRRAAKEEEEAVIRASHKAPCLDNATRTLKGGTRRSMCKEEISGL